MKSTPAISVDEQMAMPSDLATKVTMLSNGMKTILDWIKAQSKAPLAMSMEKSGLLLRTLPKSCVMPMKGAAKNTSGVWDDDDSDDDMSMAPSLAEGRLRPFKVEAKVEIPNYDGAVDAQRLDVWLD